MKPEKELLREKTNCQNLKVEGNNSFQAENWNRFLRTSKNYVESCRGVDGPESVSQTYSDMAVAFLAMNRPNEALDSANSCSSIYYQNPSCHINKTIILLRLNRFEEAKNSLNIAERVTRDELSAIDSSISTSRDSEREVYKKKKSELMQKLELIELIRKIFSLQKN
jgi:tetratricopeptide (TPR) repeat protein